jgi:erythromycin esterase-like protein
MQVFTLPEYRKNTLSNALALAGPEAFFIDLTTTNNKLFSTKGNVYYIGGGFRPAIWERYSKPIIAKKQFDGLIFINTTTSAVPIDRKPVK